MADAAPVHPHGRGDNYATASTSPPTDGSPPRAWGQFGQRQPLHAVDRFTPTGVGTIRAPCVRRRAGAVHPHGRGDNANTSLAIGWMNGSPPRAWGQWRAARRRRARRRFTPTGVGTIAFPPWQGKFIAVHPHGRGDNNSTNVEGKKLYGSPPRAWGQSSACEYDITSSRFTPTGVGTMNDSGLYGRESTVHPHGRGDNSTPRVHPSPNRGSPPRALGQC